jgi:hypothetical protein
MIFGLVFLSACTIFNKNNSNDNEIANNNSFSSDGTDRKIHTDNLGFTLNLKKFKGTIELAKTDVSDPVSVDISYELICNSGKAKLALIKPNNKIVTINENNCANSDDSLQKTTINLEKGINKIKIISDDYTDIDLKFRQSETIFVYTKGFPFSPLFGNGIFNEEEEKWEWD